MGQRSDSSLAQALNDVFGHDVSILRPNALLQTEPPLSWHRSTRQARELIEHNEKKKRLYEIVSIRARTDAVRNLKKCA